MNNQTKTITTKGGLSTQGKVRTRNLILFSSLFLNSQTLFAQSDNLEPIEASIVTFNQSTSKEYYSNINQILLKGLEPTSLARVVVLPAFSDSYILSIEGHPRKAPVLVKRSAPINHKTKNVDSVKTTEKTINLSASLAKKVNDVFLTSLSHTRYPEESRNGLDGVTYYFSASKKEIGQSEKSGKIWSPQGKKMSDLIAITELMNEMVENNKPELSDKIIEKCDLLLKAFDEG